MIPKHDPRWIIWSKDLGTYVNLPNFINEIANNEISKDDLMGYVYDYFILVGEVTIVSYAIFGYVHEYFKKYQTKYDDVTAMAGILLMPNIVCNEVTEDVYADFISHVDELIASRVKEQIVDQDDLKALLSVISARCGNVQYGKNILGID